MTISPETHAVLTDLKLSEVQHFLATIHEDANGSIFLDDLHNLEWTALSLAGEAGELANKIKKIRRDRLDVLSGSPESQEALSDIRREAADINTYLIVMATLLGLSLSDFLDLTCSAAAEFAERRGLDLTGIASRGGVLFKYVIPMQVLSKLTPEQLAEIERDPHDTNATGTRPASADRDNAQPQLPGHYGTHSSA